MVGNRWVARVSGIARRRGSGGQFPASPRLASRQWLAPLAITGGAAAAVAAGWLSASRSPWLAGSVVVGGVGGVWALRRPEVALVSLVLIITLLPFGVVPARLGASPTLLDVATAGVFLVWLGRVAVRGGPARFTLVGIGLTFLAGAMLAAYVFSNAPLRPDETARMFGKIVAAHLLFIPVLNLVASRPRVCRLVGWLLAAASLEGLIAVALYLVPGHVASRALVALGPLGYPMDGSVLRYLPDTQTLRATGTAVDPNMLGALLMMAGTIAVSQLLAARPAISKTPAGLTLAAVLPGLLLTYSRGSWLGLAGGLSLVGALRYRRLWLAFLLAAALALAVPQAGDFTGHLGSGLRAQDRASAMRLGELRNAYEIISRYPWFGVGWANERAGGTSIDLDLTVGVSNVALTVAERSGLLALALYTGALLALAGLLWPAVKERLHDHADDGLLLGLVAALVAAQIAGLVDHHFVLLPHLVSLLWLVAALAVVLAGEARDLKAR